jgi:glycosyltransferase involved in cell wall biosynthesis
MSKQHKKIYFLVPYPHGAAPSQRFRFEQYYDILTQQGFEFRISSFLDMSAWDVLYKPGHFLLKTIKILSGFGRRVADLFRMTGFDFVFIHREAAPIGPPVLEWVIAKILRKKIVYDFDDAIWLPNTSANNKIAAGLKWHSKVESICRWSYKVSCGNEYLADYARQYNANAVVNPTTIDTVHLHNRVKDQNTSRIVIGWTGTHSTAQYLDDILPIIEKLEKSYDFTFMVISNAPLISAAKSLRYVPWNKDTEIDDLMQFNIGLMPLSDDLWAKGKCGFKALQYMSLGIPALVSPVGVNTRIVDDGMNGAICASAQDWERAIVTYITDTALRVKTGTEARKKIEDHYSVLSNSANFIGLFA